MLFSPRAVAAALDMSGLLRLNGDMKSSAPDSTTTTATAMTTTTMTIGAVADRFGLATHVLRHWETMDLLRPGRDAGGRRRYDADDLTRVALILQAKDAGLALDTIRALAAAAADPTTRRDILRREAAALRSRIAAAQTSLELLEGALGCAHDDLTRCPNYRRMVAQRLGTPSRTVSPGCASEPPH